MRRIYIQSCHATLEYDHARMFVDIGREVAGQFDVGSTQRPKIIGVTDHSSPMLPDDIVVLHQVPDYTAVFERLLQAGQRVILVSFGQADTWQYEKCAEICRLFPQARIAAYSSKDFRRHTGFLTPPRQLHLIRFGKYFDDFEPWIGNERRIYAACNSIHKRGHGCGWEMMRQLMEKLPIDLSGSETMEVDGLNEVPESTMRYLYRNAAGFLSFGTVPACLVLTQIEAWCAGCPTVIYDNGCGIAQEGLAGCVTNNLDSIIVECQRLLKDGAHRQERHIESLHNRIHFDASTVKEQWRELFAEMDA